MYEDNSPDLGGSNFDTFTSGLFNTAGQVAQAAGQAAANRLLGTNQSATAGSAPSVPVGQNANGTTLSTIAPGSKVVPSWVPWVAGVSAFVLVTALVVKVVMK